MPKSLTREQAESRQRKAVRFVRDVLHDPNRADEIEDESLDSYAERKDFRIVNPSTSERKLIMATTNKTKTELQDEIEDLQEELDAAYSKLDNIAGIASGDEDDDEDDDGEEEDEEED